MYRKKIKTYFIFALFVASIFGAVWSEEEMTFVVEEVQVLEDQFTTEGRGPIPNLPLQTMQPSVSVTIQQQQPPTSTVPTLRISLGIPPTPTPNSISVEQAVGTPQPPMPQTAIKTLSNAEANEGYFGKFGNSNCQLRANKTQVALKVCGKPVCTGQPEIDALMKAVRNNDEATAQLLVDAGVRPQSKVNQTTCLQAAVRLGNSNILKIFLASGIVTEESRSTFSPSFQIAVEQGHLHIVKLLLQAGVTTIIKSGGKKQSTEEKIKYKRTLNCILNLAIIKNLTNIVKYIILHEGIQDFCKDKHLMENTIDSNNLEILRMLILSGIDVNPMDSIQYALNSNRYNFLNMLYVLHVSNISKSIPNEKNQYIPNSVIKNGDLNIFKILIDIGFSFRKTKDGEIPILALSSNFGKLSITKYLVEKGANVDEIGDGGTTTPLIEAVKENRIEITKYLLKQNASCNIRNKLGFTAIHYAATLSNSSILEILISHGCNVNILAASGNKTALFVSILANISQNAKILLQHGANCSILSDGRYPIHAAIDQGLNMLQVLIDFAECDVNAKNDRGYTILHTIVEKNRDDLVKILFETYPYCESKNIDNIFSPIHQAAKYIDCKILSLFIKYNCNVNIKDKSGNTALHFATEVGNVKGVQLLLENGAVCDARNASLVTPLHLACSKGNSVLISILIDAGSNINAKDATGETPLHKTVKFNNENCTDILISNGASCKFTTNEKSTPLHYACKYGSLSILKNLVDYGCNVSSKDSEGETPLHITLDESMYEHAKFLSEKMTNFDIVNKNGSSYLLAVVSMSSKKITVQNQIELYKIFLLDKKLKQKDDFLGNSLLHGAAQSRIEMVQEVLKLPSVDVNYKNILGETPIFISSMYSKISISLLLHSQGALVTEKTRNGENLIHYAALAYPDSVAGVDESNNFIKLLLNKGISIHEKNLDGDTPLHMAAKSGHFNILKFLIAQGAKVKDKNNNGKTAMDIALQMNRQIHAQILANYKGGQ